MKIKLNNQEVEYFDNGLKKKHTLLFVHGNSSCSKSFKYQITDLEISTNYRTVTLDLPGHGESKKFEDASKYSLEGYQSIILDLIESIEVENPILIGHSLGGHICIELSQKIKQLQGIVIFQSPPIKSLDTISNAFTGIDEGVSYKAEVEKMELEKYCNLVSETDRDEVKKWFLKTDPMARQFLGQSVSDGNFGDEISILNSLQVPKAIFHGNNDLLINKDYLENLELSDLWTNKLVYIPNSTHSPHMEQSEYFNERLKAFLMLLN